MNALKAPIALALTAAGMLAVPNQASAWSCISGSCPRWCRSVPYALGAASPDLGDAVTESEVRRGMDDWTLRSCTSLTTTYTGRTSARPGDGDGQSVIGWIESGWPHDPVAIGVSGPRWGGDGCVVEADMSMNGVDHIWTTDPGRGSTVNAYSIALHEGGHYYGLGHAPEDPNATMYPAYTGGIDMLNSNDEAGICTLYPGEGPVDCNTSGCPSGQECVGNRCQAITGDGTVCSPCSSDAECGGPNDLCIGYPDGGQFCGRACTGGDCGDGFVCARTSGGLAQCAGLQGENFTCAGVMPEPSGCTLDSMCAANQRCDTTTGECVARPTNLGDLGDSCEMNEQCNSNLCFAGRCSASCDWLNTRSCPDGFYCNGEATGACGTGFCMPGSPGAAPFGAACANDTDCDSLMCHRGACSIPCRGDSSVDSCPPGTACEATAAAGCGACQTNSSTELGGLGEACLDHRDCETALCATRGEGDNFCTALCDSENLCPDGFTCSADSDGLCEPPEGRDPGGVCGCSAPGAGPKLPWQLMVFGLIPGAWFYRRRRAR